MSHLTLQEVLDRINQDRINLDYPSAKEPQTADHRDHDHAQEEPHRPEFYVPRITRRLAGLMFGAHPS